MTKLTDTQLIVLSSAAQHDEGLAPRPTNLNAAAAMKVASSLINKGLVREIRAKADPPLWHENEDGRFALKITRAGREAIGVNEEEEQHAARSSASPEVSKAKKDRSRRASKKDGAKTSAPSKKAARQKTAGDAEPSSGQIRAGSKQAKIIELMKRAKGATSMRGSKRRSGCRTPLALHSPDCASADSRWSASTTRRRGQFTASNLILRRRWPDPCVPRTYASSRPKRRLRQTSRRNSPASQE
jgi:hypothetical protein